MSHTSPATYLVWSIMSCLLGVFLLFHLWKFDRFKCLRWHNGPYAGAFKRLMTYTYLLSVPCIIAYAIGFAVIKYEEGLVDIPGFGIVPKPSQMWSQSHQDAIFPLYLLFTIAWGLEMVTHLEELCFWLFLVNSGSVKQDWFRSLYFKTWIGGSLIAVTYMPLVTIFTRSDPQKVAPCEAFTFLAGSLGSLSLTLWFVPILWTFPTFLHNLKRNAVDARTIVRLTTFHELNCLRVIFRLAFVLPLMVLAVDGIRPHQHVNESMLWTELLTSIAAVGCVTSSAITLVIFFPRSVESELQSRNATREPSQSRHVRRDSDLSDRESSASPYTQKRPASAMYSNSEAHSPMHEYPPLDAEVKTPGLDVPMMGPKPIFSPNRRAASGVVIQGTVGLTERELQAHNQRMSNVHPFVHNFTSPIDLMDGAQQTRWYVKRQYGPREV